MISVVNVFKFFFFSCFKQGLFLKLLILYKKGEEEVSLGLPQSKHMSRHNPKMSKLQEDFISVLVKGLCNSYQSANLLPGVILKKQDTEDAQGENEGVFHSELSSNMESNYKMWCQITRQEEAKEAEKRICK